MTASALAIWLSMLDPRRSVICTPAHIDRPFVHTANWRQVLPENPVPAAEHNGDKAGFSNEAAAANGCSPMAGCGTLTCETPHSGYAVYVSETSCCAGR
jgi:hypothetical protein